MTRMRIVADEPAKPRKPTVQAQVDARFREGIIAAVRRGQLDPDVVAVALDGPHAPAVTGQATTVLHRCPNVPARYALNELSIPAGSDHATCLACGATTYRQDR